MFPEDFHLQLVIILTLGFSLASFLGYVAQALTLSPILGYLFAGFLIGPYSPGYIADLKLSEQLAEVGVMLMMFGVGLHFKWQDLVNVKNIAVPGAFGQTFVATVLSAIIYHLFGGEWATGIILGLAIGVASTVVLIRVLSDRNLIHTKEGHIAIGWLIVEDILTVVVLILLPTIVAFLLGQPISFQEIFVALFFVFFKLSALTLFMFTLGRKIASFMLLKIAKTRSPELFILTVLALIFFIATSSALVFGTSIALGAFIAGMIIGQTDVSHQASAYASPLKDSFVVIFFLTVGMLFNPQVIVEHFWMFLSILGIILVIKPLVAFFIGIVLGYPASIAISIAIALAQIGEFSFILAEEAAKYHLFPDESFDIVIACAFISIAINPSLFKLMLRVRSRLPRYDSPQSLVRVRKSEELTAVVIGFGIIGEKIVRMLERRGYRTVIIDDNMEKITRLLKEDREAIFGEASFPNMLTHVNSASILVITIPDMATSIHIIRYAQQLHPNIMIIARAKSEEDERLFRELGVHLICCEDEEMNHAFQRLIFELPKMYTEYHKQKKSTFALVS